MSHVSPSLWDCNTPLVRDGSQHCRAGLSYFVPDGTGAYLHWCLPALVRARTDDQFTVLATLLDHATSSSGVIVLIVTLRM
jgi:hypothetical protein